MALCTIYINGKTYYIRLVVSTHLKNSSQIASSPQVGVKIINTVFETTTQIGHARYFSKGKSTGFPIGNIYIDSNGGFPIATVDGRNPAPPGMVKNPK